MDFYLDNDGFKQAFLNLKNEWKNELDCCVLILQQECCDSTTGLCAQKFP